MKTKIINNRFDTDKPILDAIFNEIGGNELPDHLFEQVCNEFEMDETDVMELMLDSKKYDIRKTKSGFLINKMN